MAAPPILSTQAVAATDQSWDSTKPPASDWLREEEAHEPSLPNEESALELLPQLLFSVRLVGLGRCKPRLLGKGLANYSLEAKTSFCHLSLYGPGTKNVFHIS